MKTLLRFLLFVVAFAVHPSVAQPPVIPVIPVSIPIHGKFAFTGNLPGTKVGPGDNQLFTIDTLSGDLNVLIQREKSIYSPIWRPDGNALAILSYFSDPVLGVYDIGLQLYTDILITPGVSLYPQAWSPNGSQILSYSYGRSTGVAQYQLQIVNVGNGAVTTLFNYAVDSLVTDIPLPQGVSNFKIRGINQAAWNPAYPEWILVQYDGYDEALIDVISGYPTLISPTFLYNLQTGEKLSINALFLDTISTTPIRWSPDGRFIMLGTNKELSSTAIVWFENISGIWTLTVVDEVRTMNEAAIDWLGVSDLLLTSADDPTDDSVFNIAQIIDGTWNTTEFMRIPAGTFERRRDLDWHLSASEEEKRGLSCLFDQAMSSRLSVGIHARVNFTTGTPLRLRTELDFDATEIVQMAEGTEFDVVGGPACVNADQYYRFWQVQLSDNTIGWAAEASSTDYFIEPYTFPVPTLTPTPSLVANAGPDQSHVIYVEACQIAPCPPVIPVSVTLDGSNSTGAITAYEWTRNGQVVSTQASFTTYLSPGSHVFTLKVSNTSGNATDSVTVLVATCDPFTCSAIMAPTGAPEQ